MSILIVIQTIDLLDYISHWTISNSIDFFKKMIVKWWSNIWTVSIMIRVWLEFVSHTQEIALKDAPKSCSTKLSFTWTKLLFNQKYIARLAVSALLHFK